MTPEKILLAEFEDFFERVFPGASARQKLDIKLTFYAGAWRAAMAIVEGGDAHGMLKAAFEQSYLFYEQAQKDMDALAGKKPQ